MAGVENGNWEARKNGRDYITDVHGRAPSCAYVIFRVHRLAVEAAEKGQGRKQQGHNAHVEGEAD